MTTPKPTWPNLESDPAVDPKLVRWLRAVYAAAPPRGQHAMELYGIHEEIEEPEFLGSSNDVYRLLRKTNPPAGLVGLGLLASGWVGSARSSLPPSQQSGRRRCRHVVVLDAAGTIASMLEIEDDPLVIIQGEEGRVPVALKGCWRRRIDAA